MHISLFVLTPFALMPVIALPKPADWGNDGQNQNWSQYPSLQHGQDPRESEEAPMGWDADVNLFGIPTSQLQSNLYHTQHPPSLIPQLSTHYGQTQHSTSASMPQRNTYGQPSFTYIPQFSTNHGQTQDPTSLSMPQPNTYSQTSFTYGGAASQNDQSYLPYAHTLNTGGGTLPGHFPTIDDYARLGEPIDLQGAQSWQLGNENFPFKEGQSQPSEGHNWRDNQSNRQHGLRQVRQMGSSQPRGGQRHRQGQGSGVVRNARQTMSRSPYHVSEEHDGGPSERNALTSMEGPSSSGNQAPVAGRELIRIEGRENRPKATKAAISKALDVLSGSAPMTREQKTNAIYTIYYSGFTCSTVPSVPDGLIAGYESKSACRLRDEWITWYDLEYHQCRYHFNQNDPTKRTRLDTEALQKTVICFRLNLTKHPWTSHRPEVL